VGSSTFSSARKLGYTKKMAAESTKKVKPKKRGRPATGRDPIMALRMPPALRERVEEWALRQFDKPSRSEALRRLVEMALKMKERRK
jgi:hypothetical protein